MSCYFHLGDMHTYNKYRNETKATQHLPLLGAKHWQHWNIIKSFLIPVPCPDTNCIHLFIISYAIGAIIFSALLSTLVKKQYDIKQNHLLMYPECKVARIVLIYTLACPISWPSASTLMRQWTFRLLILFSPDGDE